MNENIIAFIGDSILDNFNKIEIPQLDVKHQLSNIIPNSKIYNFAVEGSIIKNIYEGITVPKHNIDYRKYVFNSTDDYEVGKNTQTLNPLRLCYNVQPDYIVTSIGGNEGQKRMNKFILGSKYFLKAVHRDGFSEQYKYLMSQLNNIKNNRGEKTNNIIILMQKPHVSMVEHFRKETGWGLQYIPIESMFNFDKKLTEVFDHFRKIYIDYARKYKFAVIDLYYTLNPNDRTHYGKTPKDISNSSGECLCKIIKSIIDNHDFNSKCKIYYAPNCGNDIYFYE